MLEQIFNVGKFIFLDNVTVVIVVLDQVIKFFFQIMEEHRVLINMLKEKLISRFAVFIELNLAILVIEVKHGIQSVEI